MIGYYNYHLLRTPLTCHDGYALYQCFLTLRLSNVLQEGSEPSVQFICRMTIKYILMQKLLMSNITLLKCHLIFYVLCGESFLTYSDTYNISTIVNHCKLEREGKELNKILLWTYQIRYSFFKSQQQNTKRLGAYKKFWKIVILFLFCVLNL